MTTLGDSLLAKGQLYAAQFCYIVSGAEWGTFAKKGSKLVLLCTQVFITHDTFCAYSHCYIYLFRLGT